MDPVLTRHAQSRMQQRGIPAEALDCLLDFGREAFDHHGGVVIYFDKAARRRLSRATPAAKDIERVSRCYAVLLEGKVVTVGHRFRRINRA
jgi:hypothetical protein